MDAFRSYFILCISTFSTFLSFTLSAQDNAFPQQEWLVTDTLDLPLTGPPYEVAFFRDEIIFLTPAFEGVSRVPMDHAVLSKRQPLFNNDNFPYSPSGISFTSDYDGCYATVHKEISKQLKLEKILAISMNTLKPAGLHPLSFMLDSCRYLHPALSPGDSLLIFSSDRLPTSGGLDLFVTRLDSLGWSQPENLGPAINSNGHERYPFLDQDYNLWFASTGHTGYGKYDLFVCPYNGMGWDRPQNLGPFVNTPADEFGFSMHNGGQAILFTRKSSSEGLALKMVNKDTSDYGISLVLINQANPPSDPPGESSPDPVMESEKPREEANKTIGEKDPDPDRLVFRVQILSSTEAGRTPTVLIEGQQYATFEYFYKGAYRITVGEFDTVGAANTFRLRCRSAGFNQAFVAAFRGKKRETDPSVFKE